MNEIINLVVGLYLKKYYSGPISLTILTGIIFLFPYNSTGGFDLTVTFYTFVLVISALITLLAFNNIIMGGKDMRLLFNLGFLSVLFSIFKILINKSFSFLGYLDAPMMIITNFLFFVTLHEAVKKCNEALTVHPANTPK